MSLDPLHTNVRCARRPPVPSWVALMRKKCPQPQRCYEQHTLGRLGDYLDEPVRTLFATLI